MPDFFAKSDPLSNRWFRLNGWPRRGDSFFNPTSRPAGAMCGSCDVTLPGGMRLRGCEVFAERGRAWVRPPWSNRFLIPAVSFVDDATRDQWSDAVIAALRAAYPGVLPE